ncbi:MAG: hypothetical protein ACRDNL_06710, partial [Spirillospora sp.]
APTVVALRSKAAGVVDAELARLAGRVPEIDGRARKEIEQTVRRVVDKLLHAPTVRVKELASAPGGDSYADALRELFDLDPKAPEAVARADIRDTDPRGTDPRGTDMRDGDMRDDEAAGAWRGSARTVDPMCAEADCVSTMPAADESIRGVSAETVNAQAANVRAVTARAVAAGREGDQE